MAVFSHPPFGITILTFCIIPWSSFVLLLSNNKGERDGIIDVSLITWWAIPTERCAIAL